MKKFIVIASLLATLSGCASISELHQSVSEVNFDSLDAGKSGAVIYEEDYILRDGSRLKVLNRPIFGIYLGESVERLKERFVIKPFLGVSLEEFEVYNINSSLVESCKVDVHFGRVVELEVWLKSSFDFDDIRDEIKSKHKVLKECIDYRSSVTFCCFDVEIDGEEVRIILNNVSAFPSHKTVVNYKYTKLSTDVWLREEDKRKAELQQNGL